MEGKWLIIVALLGIVLLLSSNDTALRELLKLRSLGLVEQKRCW